MAIQLLRVFALPKTIKRRNSIMLVEMRKLNKREQIVVSSRDIAETFEKEHKEVLYAIEGRLSET